MEDQQEPEVVEQPSPYVKKDVPIESILAPEQVADLIKVLEAKQKLQRVRMSEMQS